MPENITNPDVNRPRKET